MGEGGGKTEAGVEGLDISVQDLAEYFYVENVLVLLTHPERLKRSFDVLAEFFDQVGISMNLWRTVSMA